MKVGQLREALADYDADMPVLVPGYERDCDVLDVVLSVSARHVRPAYEEGSSGDWFYGTHQVGAGEPHVLLASSHRAEYAQTARTMERSRVVSDPETLGGTPVFAGTRVPVRTLFENLAGGVGLDEFLRKYPTVTRERVSEVLNDACDLVERSAS